tara:strand:+ start:1354 stop:1617 length:264 start_codon:yes stop_codon:yes gene_type:complete
MKKFVTFGEYIPDILLILIIVVTSSLFLAHVFFHTKGIITANNLNTDLAIAEWIIFVLLVITFTMITLGLSYLIIFDFEKSKERIER